MFRSLISAVFSLYIFTSIASAGNFDAVSNKDDYVPLSPPRENGDQDFYNTKSVKITEPNAFRVKVLSVYGKVVEWSNRDQKEWYDAQAIEVEVNCKTHRVVYESYGNRMRGNGTTNGPAGWRPNHSIGNFTMNEKNKPETVVDYVWSKFCKE